MSNTTEDYLDEDGYPTQDALDRIAEWPYTDIAGLLEFAEPLWSYPDRWTVEGDRLFLSTGGWSGNESIIDALERNVFWLMCWEQSRRGGHYIFDLSCVRAQAA